MFHVLLLPLFLLGSLIGLLILIAPFVVGILLSVRFPKKSRIRYIPWGLGFLGLVLSIAFLYSPDTSSGILGGILFYWILYFTCILFMQV